MITTSHGIVIFFSALCSFFGYVGFILIVQKVREETSEVLAQSVFSFFIGAVAMGATTAVTPGA